MPNRIVTEDNYNVGDKVVRGRDWTWGNQDEGSVYGIIDTQPYDNLVSVNWVNHKGITVNFKGYRVGDDTIGLKKFDLYFYEQ